jgi:hypothetical protein
LSSYDGGPVAPISDAMVADMPNMADFAAAAEILNQMSRDEKHIDPEHIHTDTAKNA